MERWIGGNPLAVLLRLAIISVIVGIVLAALGLSPAELLSALQRLAQRIYDMGFGAITWALQYFLIGAVIVFPIWAIIRVLKLTRGNRNGDA